MTSEMQMVVEEAYRPPISKFGRWIHIMCNHLANCFQCDRVLTPQQIIPYEPYYERGCNAFKPSGTQHSESLDKVYQDEMLVDDTDNNWGRLGTVDWWRSCLCCQEESELQEFEVDDRLQSRMVEEKSLEMPFSRVAESSLVQPTQQQLQRKNSFEEFDEVLQLNGKEIANTRTNNNIDSLVELKPQEIKVGIKNNSMFDEATNLGVGGRKKIKAVPKQQSESVLHQAQGSSNFLELVFVDHQDTQDQIEASATKKSISGYTTTNKMVYSKTQKQVKTKDMGIPQEIQNQSTHVQMPSVLLDDSMLNPRSQPRKEGKNPKFFIETQEPVIDLSNIEVSDYNVVIEQDLDQGLKRRRKRLRRKSVLNQQKDKEQRQKKREQQMDVIIYSEGEEDD